MMTAILHVELAGTGPSLGLRYWRDDPAAARSRTLAPEPVAELARLARTSDFGLFPAALGEVGARLYRWLDGDERWLSAEIAAAANDAPVLVLALCLPAALAPLPWEALHDGTGFLVHGLNPPVLPIRWRAAAHAAREPRNRPLRALFMAASPRDVQPLLDYEKEEHDILAATERSPLDLLVEESGSLEELGALMRDYGAGEIDLLHLTGHAGHAGGTPVFTFENDEGLGADASGPRLARALPDRPPLLFLSGCRTAERPGEDAPSLAETLLDAGFRAVLGWGRPVRDGEAALAAGELYRHLAAGEPLARALIHAHERLREAGARDWHLLRLSCAGEPPGPLVTPLRTPGRPPYTARPAESEFLEGVDRRVRVATRAAFVGRRRLLQRGVRALRQGAAGRAGVLLHGQGGRGKSSVAARLCDRLRGELRPVVVTGRLDETSLLHAWSMRVDGEDARRALRWPDEPLRFRIAAELCRAAAAGGPPLFVLDDFEQNQPDAADGDLRLAPHAAQTLLALLEALEHTGTGRVLITGRYALPSAYARYVESWALPPLDPNEQEKQFRRLRRDHATAAGSPPATRAAGNTGAELPDGVRAAADGNPRLAEWLHQVLFRPELDAEGIVAELRAAEERFREEILAGRLVASLPVADRTLLGRMLLLRLPVPLAAAAALDPARPAAAARGALEHGLALGLVDVTGEDGEPAYRVPRQLGPVLPPVPGGVEGTALAEAALGVLLSRWAPPGHAPGDRRAAELVRLGVAAGRPAGVAELAVSTAARWLDAYRYAEAGALLETVAAAGVRDPLLLLNLARAAAPLGEGDRAESLLREAAAACPPERGADRAEILLRLGRLLHARGRTAEALALVRDTLLPLVGGAGGARMRALAEREVADLLHRRGEVDEALRILRDQVLPAFERLGDTREYAVTLGEIAIALHARGELDEALRIRRDELLPLFERLGDVRERMMALGGIADALVARGELAEALRIRVAEQLPVYERIGDVRQRAVVMGKIADIRDRLGEVDEALRIRRDEQLPVFRRLGDDRARAVVLGKVADILYRRGELDEALRIRRQEQLPLLHAVDDVRGQAVALGKVASLLAARGEVDESLRIRLEEELPVLEQLRDLRARTRAIGKVGDLRFRQGDLDEALRIRLEEQLPVYDRLGDVHARAVVLGKVADVLHARGELDEAVRLRREEQLPVFARLGDVRREAIARGRLAALLRERGERDEAIRILRDQVVPVLTRLGEGYELVRARLLLGRLLVGRDGDDAAGREHLAWCHGTAARGGYADLAEIERTLRELDVPLPS